jgi:hypothetical protein
MHENTLPVPQKGHGTPVKVNNGQPLTLSTPAISFKNDFKGAKYTFNSPSNSKTISNRIVFLLLAEDCGTIS